MCKLKGYYNSKLQQKQRACTKGIVTRISFEMKIIDPNNSMIKASFIKNIIKVIPTLYHII